MKYIKKLVKTNLKSSQNKLWRQGKKKEEKIVNK